MNPETNREESCSIGAQRNDIPRLRRAHLRVTPPILTDPPRAFNYVCRSSYTSAVPRVSSSTCHGKEYL